MTIGQGILLASSIILLNACLLTRSAYIRLNKAIRLNQEAKQFFEDSTYLHLDIIAKLAQKDTTPCC